VGEAFYFDAVNSLAEGRIIEGLAFLTDAYSRSSDVGQLVDGFATFFKDLLLVKYGAVASFSALAEQFSEAQLLSLINVAWDIRAKVRYTGVNNRTVIDLMFIQFARVLGKSAVSPLVVADKRVDKTTLKAMFS
jgi:hypothetical protein